MQTKSMMRMITPQHLVQAMPTPRTVIQTTRLTKTSATAVIQDPVKKATASLESYTSPGLSPRTGMRWRDTLLRFVGNEPISGERHLYEQLRCRSCGEIYTAPLPTARQGQCRSMVHPRWPGGPTNSRCGSGRILENPTRDWLGRVYHCSSALRYSVEAHRVRCSIPTCGIPGAGSDERYSP